MALVRSVGKEIRRSDSLFASQRIAAHFIQQRYLYTEPPIPTNIDCAFLDLLELWRTGDNLGRLRDLRCLQRQAESLPGLRLVAADDGLVLYSRHGAGLDARQLVERDALPQGAARQSAELGHGVKIVATTVTSVAVPDDPDSDLVRVTAYSTVATRTDLNLAVQCVMEIRSTGEEPEACASRFQPLGQGIWPIARWETNRFYVDDFAITVPKGFGLKVTSVRFAAVPLGN